MKFSLIIPCYNEALNLPLLLERCGSVAKLGEIEILLVDNGSSDNTPEVLAQLLPRYPGCRSIRVQTNRGYGFGIVSGLRAATGDILGWTHADMQTDPKDALKGIQFFDQHGHDILVKGRRFGRPIADVVFTLGMSIFETLLLGQRLFDINAQPTMFSRRFFETWGNPPDDFSLDLYAYYLARKAGMSIFRFPVLFAERAHGVSHWNVNWQAKRKFIRRTVDFSLKLRKELPRG
jgi:glycosyltransferase involved in cell wall biosynthesis